MANQRREAVNYQKLTGRAILSDGLLGVAREGGDLERKVAEGFFRLAGVAGQIANEYAEADGARAGRAAAMAGSPGAATVSGRADPASAGGPVGGKFALGDTGKAARRDAIASIESRGSGDYAAIGPRHPTMGRALGRYQVMEANIGPWSKAALGREVTVDEFIKNPDIQDAIFDHKFDGYVNQFGLEGAAQAWFAGPGGVGKTNRHDSLGTDVGSYGQRFLAALGSSPAGDIDPVQTGAIRPEGVSVGEARAVAAPGVVPAPVTIERGRAGGFQPTNSSSIYGRAYDAAGTKTYLQQLDTTMRSDIFNVYMATKDDPVALQSKLNDLKKLQLEDHVFDEIRPEYENAFARMTQPYIEQAIRDQETRRDQQNRAEFLSRTSQLETDVQRRIASVSADNPGAVDAVQSAQAAIDDHFDAAVAHGIMTADDAAKAKITSRRATAVGFYLRQAENLPSNKVAALRKTMQSDFAAGGLDGLDGDGWEILDAKLDALERSKRVEDNQAKTALTKRGNEFVERLAAGFEVDEAAFAKFKLDASTATGGQAIVDETVAKIDLAQKLAGLPIQDAQAKVLQLRRDLGSNPTDAQLRTYGYASKFVEAKAKLLADDPVAYVQNADPAVRAAWSEVSADNPASFEKAISATVAAQERLGVVSPKVLPKSVAQAAVSQFNNAKLEDNDRIAGVTNLMFATDDRAQRRAIFDQMVGAGLDGFTEGAFNALDRGDPEAARRLFQAAMLDPDKQPGTLPVKPSEIDDEIQANIMADGKIGDIYYGLSGGTAQNYLLAERDAKLMKRAVQMRLRAGQDVNAAVAGVARDLYGDVVPIQRTGSVNAEILLPRDRDPVDVMAGLNEMKSRVRSALEAAVPTPEGVKVSDGGRAIHNAVTKNHIASILDEGVFRSAGDGFVFIDGYSGLAVPGKDGKPLLFSLEDVTMSGRAALAARKVSDPIADLNEWRAGQ
ncbi:MULTISPECIES: hypothetical protein [unclassified Brucella]|uniref:hypothetical protein n=1 Tax=unclassified Brucella TaxID=2632610 RepID=UPI00097268EE|nr:MULTISPECIES: hypothetical protein [unclassified Brucella]APY13161.1 hypothetical protein BKD02_01570 [Brucella sp. 09RB8910]